MNNHTEKIVLTDLGDLIRRMELEPILLKRKTEEEITKLVSISDDDQELIEAEKLLIADQNRQDWLDDKNWSSEDLDLHLRRPLALKRFALQQFGPGIEELFMASQGDRDEVIYSLLRIHDRGLSWELYMRLTEGEITFPDAARHYGEGPEAQRNGVMGPMGLGELYPPVLKDWLRGLKPGEVHPPEQLGEWFVILRLERISPARLDPAMRQTLLDEQLNMFLTNRVEKLKAGEPIEKLYYHQDGKS